MRTTQSLYPFLMGVTICLFVLPACKGKEVSNKVIVTTPEEIRVKATDIIRDLLKSKDTTLHLSQISLTRNFYDRHDYNLFWSDREIWKPIADSMYELIENSQVYGLFPEDYHFEELMKTRRRFNWDSTARGDRKDALLWSRADILLTDAFIQLLRDIKIGRLPNDSISLNKDSTISEDFILQQFNSLQQNTSLKDIVHSLEPQQRGYFLIQNGIRKFLDSADFRDFTFVPSPAKDSVNFRKLLQKRLYEGGYIAFDSAMADSGQLAQAVKKFQQQKNITVDGRAGEGTLRMMNLSDREKFIRVAISMDKYKKLPAVMPSKYIWVNTSSNYMDVVEDGEIKLSSKVICGKPKTRTPLLNSAISALITYPQWVPPPSIVAKEILPAVKKNPGYLAKKGFSLLDSKGDEVDPFSVDWTKYNKSIPYRVVQGSGDANALGVLKFHFDNKYSVYLHDTNQRYLFGNAMRSMSHGCVRVQEWQELAYYILRNDSLHSGGRYSKIDSVKTWLKNKEKHQLALKNRMPVFIRYFTCEGRANGLVFYDDVYGEDKMLRQKYFALK